VEELLTGSVMIAAIDQAPGVAAQVEF